MLLATSDRLKPQILADPVGRVSWLDSLASKARIAAPAVFGALARDVDGGGGRAMGGGGMARDGGGLPEDSGGMARGGGGRVRCAGGLPATGVSTGLRVVGVGSCGMAAGGGGGSR